MSSLTFSKELPNDSLFPVPDGFEKTKSREPNAGADLATNSAGVEELSVVFH
jgi:hypothetical protein